MKASGNVNDKTKQESEADSGVTQVLEWSDLNFKITMVNILRALMKKTGQCVRNDG